jgi:hypothetical protein
MDGEPDIQQAAAPEMASSKAAAEGLPLSSSRAEYSLPAGTAHLRLNVELPEDACLTMEVEARTPDGKLLSRQSLAVGMGASRAVERSPGAALRAIRARSAGLLATLPSWLTAIALGVYLLVRLIALPDFPIYFFTDEAAQTVLAADLLRSHLFGPGGEFLPTYFVNGSLHNLSVSVYLQVMPYFLFGKSIWVTRGAAALATLIAAVSVGLMMNRVFKSRFPWLAVLFLSITPAWFLHSRTAFETALAASFYAAFLYCYLMYRCGDPRWLYGAVGTAALAFYSYNPMRVIITTSAVLLLISDIRYHRQQGKIILRAGLLAALLAVPFARFLILHPQATGWQMRLLGSYWLPDLPLTQKLARFAAEYLRGLDLLYWYLPNDWDLPRHIMAGYGHLLRQTMPLGLFGVGLALRNFRDPRWRVLLIAVLAAPSGAALVQVGITRVLVMVIPMALLTALAAQWLMERLEDWVRRRQLAKPSMLPFSQPVISIVVFLALSGANFYMLSDSLSRGPVWFRSYGLTGMQWGARQVFAEVRSVLERDPAAHVVLSPSWTNGTDVVARFFFSDPLPFELGGPSAFFHAERPIEENTLLVMTADEYRQIPRAHFSEVRVEKILDDPNGQPGFYFMRLKYVENVAQVIAAEEELHRRPQSARVLVGGAPADVQYPLLDIGSIEQAFDGSPETLVRTNAINPLGLEVNFLAPRRISSLRLRVGGAATFVKVSVWPSGDDALVEAQQNYPASMIVREISLRLPRTIETSRLLIELSNSADGPDGAVHLWEVTFE